MNPRRDSPSLSFRPLSDAEFYALSEKEKLDYLTRMLIELDRLHLKFLREAGVDTDEPYSDVKRH